MDELARLRTELASLIGALDEAERQWTPWLVGVEPGQRGSARNLVHYWAIRQRDLRDLQHQLAVLGLSSLGRSEPHVAATIQAVDRAVYALAWQPRNCVPVRLGEGAGWLAERP